MKEEDEVDWRVRDGRVDLEAFMQSLSQRAIEKDFPQCCYGFYLRLIMIGDDYPT